MSRNILARRPSAKRSQRGQGMTEYIIIVGLIAILLIGAIKAFKNQLGSTYMKAKGAINDNVTEQIQNVDDTSEFE